MEEDIPADDNEMIIETVVMMMQKTAEANAPESQLSRYALMEESEYLKGFRTELIENLDQSGIPHIDDPFFPDLIYGVRPHIVIPKVCFICITCESIYSSIPFKINGPFIMTDMLNNFRIKGLLIVLNAFSFIRYTIYEYDELSIPRIIREGTQQSFQDSTFTVLPQWKYDHIIRSNLVRPCEIYYDREFESPESIEISEFLKEKSHESANKGNLQMPKQKTPEDEQAICFMIQVSPNGNKKFNQPDSSPSKIPLKMNPKEYKPKFTPDTKYKKVHPYKRSKPIDTDKVTLRSQSQELCAKLNTPHRQDHLSSDEILSIPGPSSLKTSSEEAEDSIMCKKSGNTSLNPSDSNAFLSDYPQSSVYCISISDKDFHLSQPSHSKSLISIEKDSSKMPYLDNQKKVESNIKYDNISQFFTDSTHKSLETPLVDMTPRYLPELSSSDSMVQSNESNIKSAELPSFASLSRQCIGQVEKTKNLKSKTELCYEPYSSKNLHTQLNPPQTTTQSPCVDVNNQGIHSDQTVITLPSDSMHEFMEGIEFQNTMCSDLNYATSYCSISTNEEGMTHQNILHTKESFETCVSPNQYRKGSDSDFIGLKSVFGEGGNKIEIMDSTSYPSETTRTLENEKSSSGNPNSSLQYISSIKGESIGIERISPINTLPCLTLYASDFDLDQFEESDCTLHPFSHEVFDNDCTAKGWENIGKDENKASNPIPLNQTFDPRKNSHLHPDYANENMDIPMMEDSNCHIPDSNIQGCEDNSNTTHKQFSEGDRSRRFTDEELSDIFSRTLGKDKTANAADLYQNLVLNPYEDRGTMTGSVKIMDNKQDEPSVSNLREEEESKTLIARDQLCETYTEASFKVNSKNLTVDDDIFPNFPYGTEPKISYNESAKETSSTDFHLKIPQKSLSRIIKIDRKHYDSDKIPNKFQMETSAEWQDSNERIIKIRNSVDKNIGGNKLPSDINTSPNQGNMNRKYLDTELYPRKAFDDSQVKSSSKIKSKAHKLVQSNLLTETNLPFQGSTVNPCYKDKMTCASNFDPNTGSMKLSKGSSESSFIKNLKSSGAIPKSVWEKSSFTESTASSSKNDPPNRSKGTEGKVIPMTPDMIPMTLGNNPEYKEDICKSQNNGKGIKNKNTSNFALAQDLPASNKNNLVTDPMRGSDISASSISPKSGRLTSSLRIKRVPKRTQTQINIQGSSSLDGTPIYQPLHNQQTQSSPSPSSDNLTMEFMEAVNYEQQIHPPSNLDDHDSVLKFLSKNITLSPMACHPLPDKNYQLGSLPSYDHQTMATTRQAKQEPYLPKSNKGEQHLLDLSPPSHGLDFPEIDAIFQSITDQEKELNPISVDDQMIATNVNQDEQSLTQSHLPSQRSKYPLYKKNTTNEASHYKKIALNCKSPGNFKTKSNGQHKKASMDLENNNLRGPQRSNSSRRSLPSFETFLQSNPNLFNQLKDVTSITSQVMMTRSQSQQTLQQSSANNCQQKLRTSSFPSAVSLPSIYTIFKSLSDQQSTSSPLSSLEHNTGESSSSSSSHKTNVSLEHYKRESLSHQANVSLENLTRVSSHQANVTLKHHTRESSLEHHTKESSHQANVSIEHHTRESSFEHLTKESSHLANVSIEHHTRESSLEHHTRESSSNQANVSLEHHTRESSLEHHTKESSHLANVSIQHHTRESSSHQAKDYIPIYYNPLSTITIEPYVGVQSSSSSSSGDNEPIFIDLRDDD